MRFRDERQTAILLASGPSAAEALLAEVAGYPILCVNDGYRLCPATHGAWRGLYAADYRWWDFHAAAARAALGPDAQYWTANEKGQSAIQGASAQRHGLQQIRVNVRRGLSREPSEIYAGGHVGNSGAQAINLAVLWGARRLVLVGFDMSAPGGKRHFFGDHPKGLQVETDYRVFLREMTDMAIALDDDGIEIWNASPKSALPWWPKRTLQEIVRCVLAPSA